MRRLRRPLVAVVVALAVALAATPVLAASGLVALKSYGPFNVSFTVGDCTIQTTELATQHYILGKLAASTNVGRVVALTDCALGQQNVARGTSVPFAVVDVAGWPLSDTIVRTFAIAVGPPTPNLVPPWPAVVQAGVNAQLIRLSPKTYAGYAYLRTGAGESDYLVVPFEVKAEGNGFVGAGGAQAADALRHFGAQYR